MTTKKKTTKNGIKVTLVGNVVKKQYSHNYVVITAFSSEKWAKKEFSKFRQDHKSLD